MILPHSLNRPTFSIPNRIEPSATPSQLVIICDVPTLSVSPIGSSPLQLDTFFHVTSHSHGFQYPQSDRALCNRFGQDGDEQEPVAFSIPNRIEPSATLWIEAGGKKDEDFQYPQSDRALCNLRLECCNQYLGIAFSIPNRIEPSATRP